MISGDLKSELHPSDLPRTDLTSGDLKSEIHPSDLLRTATVGARTRPLRAALSALGIMIGIGAMVAVLGLSESSKSELLEQLEQLGTNLLTVQAGAGIGRGEAVLPEESVAMSGRIGPVQATAYVSSVDANAYRTDLVPEAQTGGIAVRAAEPNLLETLGGTMKAGVFLDGATASYPAVVLGSVAADRLGIRSLENSPQIWLGGEWFAVVGILDGLTLHPDLDRSVLAHERLVEIGASCTLRETGEGPYVTDQGNYIVDCGFGEALSTPAPIASAINNLPGVVEHGLFLGVADHVVVAAEGGARVLDRVRP